MPGLVALTRRLKSKLATGGTIRDGAIELQGDQAQRVARLLHEEGISTNPILPKAGDP